MMKAKVGDIFTITLVCRWKRGHAVLPYSKIVRVVEVRRKWATVTFDIPGRRFVKDLRFSDLTQNAKGYYDVYPCDFTHPSWKRRDLRALGGKLNAAGDKVVEPD